MFTSSDCLLIFFVFLELSFFSKSGTAAGTLGFSSDSFGFSSDLLSLLSSLMCADHSGKQAQAVSIAQSNTKHYKLSILVKT
jgi:hypothetical protein